MRPTLVSVTIDTLGVTESDVTCMTEGLRHHYLEDTI